MEEKLSVILDNILGLLLLEGSYEVDENEESVNILIETPDAARLIGARGESLQSLQLLINQIVSPRIEDKSTEVNFKRVIVDVAGWRKQKEEELKTRAGEWAAQALESGEDVELEEMPSWQRRIVHMVVGDIKGIESESVGEGRDRHIIIRAEGKKARKNKKD
jgi:spoIIIJ-associated protein